MERSVSKSVTKSKKKGFSILVWYRRIYSHFPLNVMAKAKKTEAAAGPAPAAEENAGSNSTAKAEETVKETKNVTRAGKVTKKGKKKGGKKSKKSSKK